MSFGLMLCKMNLANSKEMRCRILYQELKEQMLLVLDGCIRTSQMNKGLLPETKPYLFLQDTLKWKGWTLMKPLLPWLAWSLSDCYLEWNSF